MSVRRFICLLLCSVVWLPLCAVTPAAATAATTAATVSKATKAAHAISAKDRYWLGFTIGYGSRTMTISRLQFRDNTSFLPSNIGYTPSLRFGVIINPTFVFGVGLRTGAVVDYSRSVYRDEQASVWQNIFNNSDLSYFNNYLHRNDATVFRNISISVPAQVSFRLHLRRLSFLLYTGPVVEAGHWQAQYVTVDGRTTRSDNLYRSEMFRTSSGKFNAWNILWGVGAGIQFNRFRIDFSSDWGMRKMADSYYWNQPFGLNFTFFW